MNELTVSVDPKSMDLDFISTELSTTYWGENRTISKLKRIIKNCFVIGLFRGDEQIAFGRVVTDFETFGYVMDVIVKEKERGNGYGKLIMKEIIEHPSFTELDTFTLKTKDAGKFYEKLGFQKRQINQFILER